jgi:hypothetical protein
MLTPKQIENLLRVLQLKIDEMQFNIAMDEIETAEAAEAEMALELQ